MVGHEEGDVAAGDEVPDGVGVEAREHVAGCSGPEGAGDYVDDAMDVVEGEAEDDAVGGVPLPCFDEGGDLGGDVGVSGNDAFGSAGGAAGVEDHRSACGVDVRQRCGGDGGEVVAVEGGDVAGCGYGLEERSCGGVGDEDGCAGVFDEVFEFGFCGGEGEGDCDASSLPDAPEGGDPLEAGSYEEGYALFV